MDNVCNRCLFSIPSKVEMAEEQEYKRCSIKLKDEKAEIEVTGSRLEEEANMAEIEED